MNSTPRLSYKKRILITFSVIISIFTAGIIFFEQQQTKHERTKGLLRTLEEYANMTHLAMSRSGDGLHESIAGIDTLSVYLPQAIRITVVDLSGNVVFDNKLQSREMENHLLRPEISRASTSGIGSNIRTSASSAVKYLYLAKKYDDRYFVRVALPYDIEVKPIVHSGNAFPILIILFFATCVGTMLYFSGKFSQSIRELKEFSDNLRMGQPAEAPESFSDDEVGKISANIIENYNLLQENRRKLALEREKLIQHFQYSEEGIAIFSKDRRPIYSNSHFLQYLNFILDKPALEIQTLFDDQTFADVSTFLNLPMRSENIFAKRIEKNRKQFNVRVIIFDDQSFELYIGDITKAEKTRLMKQEMTNNIAHELRTPVTSIRGYLETMLNLAENEEMHRNAFLQRAYAQSMRLSELIQDIGMLTKIEEASDKFEKEEINIRQLLDELAADLSSRLREQNARFVIDVAPHVTIYGSYTLLYSIFRNLAENALMYAGENIEIVARCYLENNQAYYFEFYDTGVGIGENHLSRIFERFYRVNEGRTRNTGGSGLGLSIVKNAVLFHHGNIVAKNRLPQGLSFLITLPKTKI